MCCTAEADPAIYVYHQIFRNGDREITRRGFMARCRLERFGEGKIYPHEETLSGPKQIGCCSRARAVPT